MTCWTSGVQRIHELFDLQLLAAWLNFANGANEAGSNG